MRAQHAFLLLATLAIPAGSLSAADVYRWTDANGQTHFTDRPRPGAERVTVTVSPPTSSPAVPVGTNRSTSGAADSGTPDETAGYRSLIITSPAQEQVLWNIEGQLDVVAAVQPALSPGHALRFTLDGQPRMADPGETGMRFQEVFRGEHTLQVEVVDGAGNTVATGPLTRFYVRQTSVANPAMAPAPTPTPGP